MYDDSITLCRLAQNVGCVSLLWIFLQHTCWSLALLWVNVAQYPAWWSDQLEHLLTGLEEVEECEDLAERKHTHQTQAKPHTQCSHHQPAARYRLLGDSIYSFPKCQRQQPDLYTITSHTCYLECIIKIALLETSNLNKFRHNQNLSCSCLCL